MPEILSPVGDWDCLNAALDNGADAVYLGLSDFNARRRAGNFMQENVGKAVKQAHNLGVKAYLTLNTLVKNNEMQRFFDLLSKSYEVGFDAIILQQLNLSRYIHEQFPDLKIHASTQASVFNALHAKSYPFVERFVLPREMTVNQVKTFINDSSKDAEIFVHGALCFSISGQCLMSSMLGGRSGNRGFCAQPCRKKYNGKYVLSPKDLCTVKYLKNAVDAGVNSLKIEGRVRSPEYVGAVTQLYRTYLDEGFVDENALEDAEYSFNRGFTSGALNKDFAVVDSTNAGKKGVELGILKDGGKIKLSRQILVGDKIGVDTGKNIYGDTITEIILKDENVNHAPKGSTVKLKLNAKTADKIILSNAVIRRDKLKPHFKPAIFALRKPKKVDPPISPLKSNSKHKMHIRAYTKDQVNDARDFGVDSIYYDIFQKDFSSVNANPYVPRCLFDYRLNEAISIVESGGWDSVFSGDLGLLNAVKLPNSIIDISANTFCDYDVQQMNLMGHTPVISPELSQSELLSFSDKRFIVYVHGRVPLMNIKYDLGEQTLTDELGYTFPVRKEADNKILMNSVPYGLFHRVKTLFENGLSQIFIDLWGESPEIINIYQKILNGEKINKQKGYTLGNFQKGVY